MLENVIEKAVIFSRNNVISAQEINSALTKDADSIMSDLSNLSLKDYIDQKEKEFIEIFLLKNEGKKQETADLLGIDRATLWKKIQKYHLDI